MSNTKFEDFKNDIDNLFSTYQDFEALKKQIDDEEAEKKENKEKKEAKEKADPNLIDEHTNEGFLKLGEALAKADKELNTTDYNKLRNATLERFGKAASSRLTKVIKIAKHTKIQEHRDKLPAGWSTLDIIASLKDCEFDEFIADETLTPTTSRLEISAKVNKAKGKEKTQSYTIKIDKNQTEDVNFASLDDVKTMLQNVGWELIMPKAKVEQ